MKKLLVLVLMALILVGCGSKNSPSELSTTVCTNETGYLVYESGTQTYTADGDKVTKLSTRGILDLGTKEQLDSIIDQLDAEIAKNNIYDGIKFSYDVVDEHFIGDMLEIDFNVADFKTITDLGILPGNSLDDADYISLAQSIKEIETQGFTCVAK